MSDRSQPERDAAALAGAKHLRSSASASPQWSTAEQMASDAIAFNAADGRMLSAGTVQSGYWNPKQVNAALQLLPMTPTLNDVPAVQVTLTKADGQNDGAVPLFCTVWNIFPLGFRHGVAGITVPAPLNLAVCFRWWSANVFITTEQHRHPARPQDRSIGTSQIAGVDGLR
jgi:hypothetical protein